jgi:hypothetical protein
MRLSKRRASAAIVAACAATAFTPAAAQAWTNSYCGVLISSGSWCGDGSDHTYDDNKAIYNGAGSVYVCERLLYANTSTMRGSGQCSPYSVIYQYYGVTTSTNFEAEVTHYSGSARHTITGVAVA